MRLVNTRTQELEEFEGDNVPSYAILSHRWEAEEVLYRDLQPGCQRPPKKGFQKLSMTCDVAAREGHSYLWVDTCCIDKSSSAELSEAINSMYRWYQESALCIVFLYDVPTVALAQSVWFTRGWTLQELIAPPRAFFFDSSWHCLGDKNSLERQLSEITSIDSKIMRCSSQVSSAPVAIRMSWAAGRTTSRIEDRAYSLLGLFDVNMPMLYGEGKKAFKRLQQEIIKQSNDTSILLWATEGVAGATLNVLASSPDEFSGHRCTTSGLWVNKGLRWLDDKPFSMTNIGLSIELMLVPWAVDIYFALLDYCHCTYDCETSTGRADSLEAFQRCDTSADSTFGESVPVIFLRKIRGSARWARIRLGQDTHSGIRGHSLHEELVFRQRLTSTGHSDHPVIQQLCTIVDYESDRLLLFNGVKLEIEDDFFTWGAAGHPERENVICANVYTPSAPKIESALGVGHIFGAIQSQVQGRNGAHIFFFAFDPNYDLVCYINDAYEATDLPGFASLLQRGERRYWAYSRDRLIKGSHIVTIRDGGNAVHFSFVGVALRLTTVYADNAYFKRLEFIRPC